MKKKFFEQRYKLQKEKVQLIINKEMTKYEEKITNEIKLSKDSSRKMFKLIN